MSEGDIVSSGIGEIVPPDLAVKAMRDSGYKNTAYALAELIDNAIQAEATSVEVMCVEERQLISERERRRVTEIAVLDDGKGMDAEVLRKALQFGNGTHLNDRSGIGRFGMGLPNASVSQCRRVIVYTWQNGARNAIMTYLDLDEIEQKKTRVVWPPRPEALPRKWADRAKNVGSSGTLVVWEHFDEHRLTWKSAKPTLKHTEELVGRIYRKPMHEGKVSIRLCAFENDGATIDHPAKVNDPLYLMAPSSTDAPYDDTPMFQKWGEQDKTFDYKYNDRTHTVTVRGAWAKQDTVPKTGRDRGAQPYGKHASRNIGVSVMRAGRELELDAAWTNPSATEERWWGIEVEFPPDLDEVFGVTNNKQAARTFASMSQFDWEAERDSDESYTDFIRRLKAEDDPRWLLIQVSTYIKDQIKLMRSRLEDQTKGSRPGSKRHREAGSVDDRASSKFKDRAAQGHGVKEDTVKLTPDNAPQLVDDLVKKGYAEPVAQEIIDVARKLGRNVIFIEADSDGQAFFSVESKPGVTEIVLNKSHPAYRQLMQVLDKTTEDATDKDLMGRISNASDTVRMLLAAWARYEIEDVPSRSKIRDMRHEWGKMARDFLTED